MRRFLSILSIAALVGGTAAIARADSLNPQPEPPGKAKNKVTREGQAEQPSKAKLSVRVKPGAAQGFNPQPDPPGKTTVKPDATKPLNPQPEPPGA